jgi:LAS superfamily LD-carboxypeptidase LdcB
MKSQGNVLIWLVSIVALAGMGASGYFAILSQNQADQIEMLLQNRNFVQNQANELKVALASASSTIEDIRDDLEDLADDYADERNRNEEFEDQIRDLSGTLGDLDKLARIDKELLQKYSKVYFLNENYLPPKIEKISDRYIQDGKDDQYFDARALDFLEDMLRDARRDGIDLKVVSAYRSFDEQSTLKGQFTQVYGSGANTFSADQGYSEHQLGTTVDITVESVGGTFASFAQTEAYEWLLDNAYKHGFILSYPEGNDFYVFEPWHWRFVGEDLARDLQRSDDDFYTMDQREIDEYRLEMFD